MRLAKSLVWGLLLTTATVPAFAATPTQESFETVYDEAKEARMRAAQVGGEWRDVGKILADAKKAADAGDMDKAVGLATMARDHSELGYHQAISQR